MATRKKTEIWFSFVVSAVSLSLSHWYPGSGVVLDLSIPDLWTLTYFYFKTNYRLMQVKSIAAFCIKLSVVIKIFVLSIFEWPFYTGFTVHKLFPGFVIQYFVPFIVLQVSV